MGNRSAAHKDEGKKHGEIETEMRFGAVDDRALRIIWVIENGDFCGDWQGLRTGRAMRSGT